MSDLSTLRDDLDAVDRKLVDALAERQRLVADVAAVKAADGALPIQDPDREQDLLSRVHALAEDAGLDGYFASQLYRQILRHSVRYQAVRQTGGDAPVRVAYQGVEGCYSHSAARHHFAAVADVGYLGQSTFGGTIEALKRGDADRALLPVENTTAGPISGVYDLLVEPGLHIVGEEVLKVEHCLLGLPGATLADIRHIGTHPQAIRQSSLFLDAFKSDGGHVEDEGDTAGAAKAVAEKGDKTRAAIAGEDAAERYGLHVLKRNIANRKDNFTRFLIVATEPLTHDARLPHKTSLVLSTAHETGALAKVLQTLAEAEVNLTKLESRPSPTTPFESLFYLDIEGGTHEEAVADAIEAARAHTRTLRVLGSYPVFRAETPRAAVASAASGDGAAVRPKATAPPSVKASRRKLVDRGDRPDSVVEIAGVRIGGDEPPVLIAGPCSVESHDQIFASARAVREAGGLMLRGGCFKPRTLPYDFQGLGYEGLTMMHDAGRENGLPIVTEVVHPRDVEAVSREADVIQIGARNMQNFELLKEVGKSHAAVLLKRGMSSSIDEWLAAAEYVMAGGNDRVILCERGIRTFETATRNTLDLSAVIVARERTHLPVIVDPSHAAGLRRWVPALAKAAIAAGAHGLIVEAHPDPDHALSDGPQSLTFDQLRQLAEEIGVAPVAA
ncbi:3-deoxy-7-phosphoheptulonate synthase [Rubrivirga sp. SAORIC476]|uniref:bifunctional 3-deoxy-7-phosphoheptulonate synthase/chorismate mutase n=1 Tax=Rubrivirga sp. SAORIC476 TaxID=1961794 RepID=UPI000BA951E4|nr:bifunctional 3-deoxy-7-phosphoheptulonate synthase/chorismate mutase [Rubrivirga sp. SAORIC476]PAP79192.1 3-deoxy-7-phosphoheptulonate synthase [Rubrivirga sp. SAORIC476]